MGPATETGQPPGLGGGGTFGDRLTEDATAMQGEDKGKSVDMTQVGGATDGQEEVEAEVCFICASPVEHNSVAPCNHRTCHICALRLRALYKNKLCAHCRVCSFKFYCMTITDFITDRSGICNLYG
jgi:E3 ubiquitin-protein ligase ZNF598